MIFMLLCCYFKMIKPSQENPQWFGRELFLCFVSLSQCAVGRAVGVQCGAALQAWNSSSLPAIS